MPGHDMAAELYARATTVESRGELNAAAALYKKLLAAQPGHAPACNRLALLYLAQGKRDKASAQYAELARIAPQTLNQFDTVIAALKQLQPAFAAGLAGGAGRSEPDGIERIAADPYFRRVLESTVVRDRTVERWLTTVRAWLLQTAVETAPKVSDDLVAFCASLARQCYINEYVFTETPPENGQAEQLKASVLEALSSGARLHPIAVAALAMYRPLSGLSGAEALTRRKWPSAVDAVVTQQVREPAKERDIAASLPRLTPISGGVTAAVRQQYEENPYPRWVHLSAPPPQLMVLDDHIRFQFPNAAFRPLGKRDSIEILIAGCGTGRYALDVTQSFAGAKVLAVDLSLASLSSAKRKTPPALADAIEFAQADIMSIGSIGRDFDYINAGGVLHHMGDPLGGWRELIKLMRPDALMQVGLYSAHARKEINAARKLVAERGYPSTAEGIHQARQDLFDAPTHFNFMTLRDFFTTSEVRDLIFHVHEQQFTIPEIKDFLASSGLRFIGFEFSNQSAHLHHRGVFQRNGWPLSDLDRWDAYERDNPDLFANMYIFWVQKA